MQKLLLSPLVFVGFHSHVFAEENLSLPPMTVTSTRTQQNSQLISTTLITRQDLVRRQVTTVEEALRGIAGINITNNGGTGKNTSIFLRGTNSDHVLVLIDGIRTGSATTGTTAFQYLPINEIDSIEVVRGPKSSLYGSEALGGIIHIRTRQGAQSAFKPTLTATTGSHDLYGGSAGVSGHYKNTWYNLNISHQETDGFDACLSDSTFGCNPNRANNERDSDGFRNLSGSFKLGHKFSDRINMEAHALYSDGNTEFDGGSQNQSDFMQRSFGGQINFQAADFWSMHLKGGESRDKAKSKLNGDYTSHFNTQRISFSAQNDFTLAKDHIFTVGYDYLDDKVKSSTKYSESSRDNHGLYAQYQGQFYNNELILSFRNDQNQQFDHHNTWSAAWGYHYEELTLSASYATAYKAPTFNDLYWPANPFFSGNPDLSPERSRSYELGLQGEHDWGGWSINGYLTYISDLIAYDSSTFSNNNLSKARIKGLELTLYSRLFDFDIQSNLTLIKPENLSKDQNKGNILPRRAQTTFRLDIDRRLYEKFSVGSTLTIEGRRFDNLSNSKRVSGFATLDLRAEYEILDNLVFQAKINNVLNKHYQTIPGYQADNLNLLFNLRYTPDV